MLRIILLLVFTLGNVVSFAQEEAHIKIIVVSDLHAKVFPYDFTNGQPSSGSLAQVKTYVDMQRNNKKQDIILLDNGDLLQGQPSGYYFNFMATDSTHLIARAMNMMRFDAATLGNHDIETGPEVYNRLRDEFNFPWLAANVLDQSTGKPFFPPYTIIELRGVRIAILGLVTPSVPDWLPRKLWEGMEFASMYATATQWIQHIQTYENPDAIIGLFHSGAGPEIDYQGDDIYLENASHYVASYVKGFDVVFTAHDHQVRNETLSNGVILLGGAPYGQSVAVADLYFRTKNNKFELYEKTSHLVNTSDLEPCTEFLRIFEADKQKIVNYVEQPIGQLKENLWSREAYFGNAAFTDFIHEMQKEITGAPISLAAPLSFDALIEKGTLRMRDMFKLYQYENYLYVMRLYGSEIKDHLEYSYGMWFNTMQQECDHLLLFRKDETDNFLLNDEGKARLQHPFFNFDSASGIKYTVDVSKEPGSRIVIESLQNGTEFRMDELYDVAINSYRGSGGGGHLTRGAGIDSDELESRIVFVTETDLRSQIAEFIKQKQLLAPLPDNNWKIIPEPWVINAIKRDSQLLFGE